MITQTQLANHLQTFRDPVDGSPMVSAARAADSGGHPDAIHWRSASGRVGVTQTGGSLPGQGTIGRIGG